MSSNCFAESLGPSGKASCSINATRLASLFSSHAVSTLASAGDFGLPFSCCNSFSIGHSLRAKTVLVHRELESGGPLVRNESRHRTEGSCGILPQRFIALVPIPKGSPGGAVEATARPSVSARETALGSVLTGALSSAHVASECTSDGNVR